MRYLFDAMVAIAVGLIAIYVSIQVTAPSAEQKLYMKNQQRIVELEKRVERIERGSRTAERVAKR